MMWLSEAESEIYEHDGLHSVKVYVMNEDEPWKHLCSGQISTKYIESFHGICLLVHSETDESLLLECTIHFDVPYKKPQRDLIIWTEPSNRKVAMYFQYSEDCEDIWEDICLGQGKDPSVEISQELADFLYSFSDMLQIWNLLEEPTCKFHNRLQNIADLFNAVYESPSNKEWLTHLLESQDYIQKLLQFFHSCEDKQNMDGLHFLYIILHGIFFLNETCLFKVMFSDECIMDVVGCLEYDPSLEQPYRHREFLTENATFKEVIPITDYNLRQKIHQTYIIKYICDILLPTPPMSQNNCLSNLTTFILSNKTEIVTMIQEDEMLLPKVFAQLKDNTVGDERWCEFLFFFKEFCEFPKTLSAPQKDALLKKMINLGIMSALKVSIHMQDYKAKLAAVEIFTDLVECNPQIVRVYAMEEAHDRENDDDFLINIMIKQIICDPDPESSHILSLTAVLRTLLDPENMCETDNECERMEFINFFYTHCIYNLAAPIFSMTGQNDSDSDDNRVQICLDNYQNAQLLGVVLELLSFCVTHHKTYIKDYILSNNLLSSVLVLMRSKHTFLVLCALRFMRQMIGHKDEDYNLYIVEKNLFEPVINAFLHNGNRYNLLNSAIIELFEFIRVENIKILIAHIMENYFEAFESVEYVQTFKGLKMKFEEEKKKKSEGKWSLWNTINKLRQKICFKLKKTEEVAVTEQPERTSSEAFDCSSSHSDASTSGMSRPHCSSMVRLVDYPDDDEEEDNDDHHDNDEEEEDEPPRKRPNLGS